MNHFPFALRNLLMLPIEDGSFDRRRHIKVSGAAMGYKGARVILQDLNVELLYGYPLARLYNTFPQTVSATSVYNAGVSQLLMRIGWKGKGYLTEELVPYGTFLNKAKPLTPTWNFAKPYRLDPGEDLTATIWPTGDQLAPGTTNYGEQDDDAINFGKCVGLMFHGVRVKDGNPIMLYDATQNLTASFTGLTATAKQPLTAKALGCPADSSILLHSVSVPTFDLNNYNYAAKVHGSMIQIYGPGGRPWMTPILNSYFPYVVPAGWGYSAQEALCYNHWIEPTNCMVGLGEERGWLKEPGEEIIVELEFPDGQQDQIARAREYDIDEWPIAVTVRGSLEVSDA